MCFKSDYQKSRKKELQFLQIIKDTNCCKIEDSSSFGYFPDWDLSITSNTTNKVSTYEIKNQKCYVNDYVLFEFGKLDGLKIEACGLENSKADYYVLSFDCSSSFYVIKKSKLEKILEENKNKISFSILQGKYLVAGLHKSLVLPFCKKYEHN